MSVGVFVIVINTTTSITIATITATRLFIIPWHVTKNRYTLKAQRMVTCDIPAERGGTLELYLYVPRVLSYVGGRQGCRLSLSGNASR
jgi:hypothetical protein